MRFTRNPRKYKLTILLVLLCVTTGFILRKFILSTWWLAPESFGFDLLHRNLTGRSILSEIQVEKDYCVKDLTNDVVVQLSRRHYLPFDDYKRYSAVKFIHLYANPVTKSKVLPALRSFKLSDGPDPRTVVYNFTEDINIEEVEVDVEKERLWRLAQGDDDMLKIKEVREELTQTDYPVPNLVHFNWYGCHRFRVDHFITLLGALRYQKPRLLLFHTDCEPSDSEYWMVLKKIAGHTLKVMKRTMPKQIWGLPMKLREHGADAARLQIMMEVGGIYLDTDSTIVRSLDTFRKHDMVLGEESEKSLAGAIIIANRTTWFLRRWYWEYKYYNSSEWGHTAVIVPWAMWHLFPNTIYVVQDLFCRPNYDEVEYIYQALFDWHKNYVVHLYARFMPEFDGRQERSLKELAVLNTTYGQIARHVIWGNEAILDITDWLLECNLEERILR